MSEADSTPRRRPPTIDLTAKEVETAAPDPTPNADTDAEHRAADSAVPGGRGGSFFSRAKVDPIGVVIGALAAGAVAVGFWLAGFVPLHQAAAPQSTVAAAPSTKAADIDEISARLDRIQQALQAQRP